MNEKENERKAPAASTLPSSPPAARLGKSRLSQRRRLPSVQAATIAPVSEAAIGSSGGQIVGRSL
jgi:hypothetical protein